MKAFAAMMLVAMMAGCASNAEVAPTHYWESAERAPENRYRIDNQACQAEVEGETGNAMFEPASDSFQAYRDCMISRGYVLRQY
ncbi:MAG: hypothetical protein U5Q16_07760 [Gammaproteobacteria bacterium]|nr:hypothetical protein [Gammaproteobacteria bacterium]